MTAVQRYFGSAVNAVDFLVGCKREWAASCVRLSDPRFDPNALWRQLMPLLLRSNEQNLDRIDDLIQELFEQFEPIASIYDEAAADFPCVRFDGRSGTACEVLQQTARDVQSWLRDDPVSWPMRVESREAVFELRQLMECSESYFPISVDDGEKLKAALRTERRSTSRESQLVTRVADLVSAKLSDNSARDERLADDEFAQLVSHTPEFDSIMVAGETFPLRGQQAELMRLLWTRAAKGHPVVSLETIENEDLNKNWTATFRDSAAKRFIVKPVGSESGKVRRSAITLSFADIIQKNCRKNHDSEQAQR